MEREKDIERARETEKEEREREKLLTKKSNLCFPWKQTSQRLNNLRAF